MRNATKDTRETIRMLSFFQYTYRRWSNIAQKSVNSIRQSNSIVSLSFSFSFPTRYYFYQFLPNGFHRVIMNFLSKEKILTVFRTPCSRVCITSKRYRMNAIPRYSAQSSTDSATKLTLFCFGIHTFSIFNLYFCEDFGSIFIDPISHIANFKPK